MDKSTKKLLEKSKSKNPDGKSVKERSKTSLLVGSVEKSKENGVRVSTNGKDDLVDGDSVAVVKKTKVVETESEIKSGGDNENVQGLVSFCDAENEEAGDCVGINDGISLLVDVSSEMGREEGGDFNEREDGGSLNGKKENSDGEIRDMSDSEHMEEDDSTDGDYEFCVGDLVWGKIKSYPWWPGQIYDSSDASDYALKVKHRDRLLVAYFDETFAWCHPSQLKSFEKNFEEMSKQSSSKGFVNAVQNVVDEIGRLVELKMTCSCVPKESLVGLARPLAVNSGIKPGVLVPEGGITKLWNYLFGPSECLAELKHVARVISINNMLEFTELKCWLSTFYRVAGGYQLPLYQEPQPIPGLEDKYHNRVLDSSNDADGRIKGPVEGQTNQSLLQKCLVDSENGQYQRRKQKSIAEIMEGYADTPAKNVEEDVTKEGTGSGNPVPSSLRKKRKDNDEANGGTNLSSRPKRRKVTKLLVSTPATVTESPIVERDGSKTREKTKKVLSSREKKNNNKTSHTENDDGSKETDASLLPVESKTVQRDDGEAKEQIEKSFLSRERKRSKYLSPPYTSVNRRQTKKDIEAEFLNVSSEAQVAEPTTRAAANLFGSESPAILLHNDEVLQKKKEAKDGGAGHEKSDTSNPETKKQDQSTVIDTMKAKASTKDVLSGMRLAAINLNSLKKKKKKYYSFDVVEGFVSIFRSFVYSNGSNYKIYNKSQPGRKRKTLDSKSVSPAKGRNQTEQGSRRTKIQKNEETKMTKDDKRKSDEPILKQAGDAKTKGRVTDGNEKSDKPKLKQFTRSQDKRRKDAETDGKAAPDINATSQLSSPFGDNCNSQLQNFSPTSKMQKLKEMPNAKSSPAKEGGKALENKSGSKTSVGEASPLNYVKQKLEMICLVLSNSDGNISPELKSKLEGDVKDLLEKVNTVAGSSSS